MGSTCRFSGGILQLVIFLAAVLASQSGGINADASSLEIAGLRLHAGGGGTLLQGALRNGSSRPSRTERVDPLDGFNKYRGGFNITDKHYWSSVVFTGVHGYGIGLLWLLSGALYSAVLLLFAPARRTTGGRGGKRKRNSGGAGRCLWSLPAGALFNCLAIVASAVVLAGSTGFHSRAGAVTSTIEAAARRASGTIYNVTNAVRSMQHDAEISGGLGVSSLLASTSRKLNDEASRIQKRAEKNARMIGRGLKILEAITVVVISLNMAAVLLLLGSGFLKLRCPFHTLLILSWVLTSLCWASFGLYFFLDRFAGDTCAALGEYQQDPRHSSLSTILPCNDKLSTKLALRDTRAGIYHLIKKVNANMSNLTSFPVATYICNPFSPPPDYNYQPENCSAGEIRIGDIPTILKRYTCSKGDDGSTCGDGEFIPAGDYNKVLVYTTSVQNLMNSFPGVESLVSCKLVKDAFSDILTRYCRPLKRDAHMSWAAMAALSTVMVLLLLTWLMAARGNSRHPSSSDVNPQLCKDTASPSTEVNKIEENNMGGSV